MATELKILNFAFRPLSDEDNADVEVNDDEELDEDDDDDDDEGKDDDDDGDEAEELESYLGETME